MPTENKPTKPLKVERSMVTKLVITGAPRLDTITVFLEDFGPPLNVSRNAPGVHLHSHPAVTPLPLFRGGEKIGGRSALGSDATSLSHSLASILVIDSPG